MIYGIPEHITKWLNANGYPTGSGEMKPYIDTWYEWMMSLGDFYDHVGRINGHPTRVKRESIHPAKRVCNEWASLLLNEDVTISTDNEAANEWLGIYLDRIGFITDGQNLVSRAFALGTGAWALWFDLGTEIKMQVRRYDARMIVPLTYDDDGVTECAFVTQATMGGKQVDQLQLHLSQFGTYHIITKVWFKGQLIASEGIIEDFDTGSPVPSFAIIKPAIDNTYVDFSPYGQSIYADAIGAVKAVDLSWDAIQNETELSKMRVFIGDLLLDEAIDKDGKTRYLPFGDDDVIFRKVAQGDATRDLIETFAPALRSRDYIDTYHMNWQTLGDLCGFGLEYFAVDKTGGLRTATEVSADNSALMRNIRKHENALEKALRSIIQAIVNASVTILGNPSSMAELGEIKIQFDDSIITDTTAEKAQDMLEVDRTLNAWEYRVKWYGETEEEAKANVPNSGIELIDYEA